MSQGYLRESVSVRADQEFVSLQFSLWDLQIPRRWVDETPGAWDLLERRLPASDLPEPEPQLSALVKLLEIQGCLSLNGNREAYTLREVRQIFSPVSSIWYGRYYSHPVWQRLREGTLSRNGLLAWLIHNYHVSRSAGVSDSRCATRLPRRDLRPLFFLNALEEYSHCDDYYFVRHPNLFLEDSQVKTYVHLPSSLAFDQQMLRMAEEDWLGHVLVSFFQESTVRFYDQCRAFYRQVEENYGIPGFFSNWEEHIKLDLEYSHAGRFAEVFDSDRLVTREDLLTSLRNAEFTFDYLLGGLDDILAEDNSGSVIRLRCPIDLGSPETAYTTLLDPWDALPAVPASPVRTWLGLDSFLSERGWTNPFGQLERAESDLPDSDALFLREDLATSIYRALSYSERHEEIILFGRVAETAFARLEGRDSAGARQIMPRSSHTMALANFLRETTTRPAEFAFLYRHACRLAEGEKIPWTPSGERELALLTDFLASETVEDTGRSATRLIQFNELYRRWFERRQLSRPFDFFQG